MWIKVQEAVLDKHPIDFEELINLETDKYEEIKLMMMGRHDWVIGGCNGKTITIFGRYYDHNHASKIFYEILKAMAEDKKVYQMPN